MTRASGVHDGFERRLGHVEESIAENRQGLSVVQTEVEALTKSVAGVASKIDALAGAMTDANRTPWASILAGGGLLLGILGIVGSFYVRDLGRSEKEIDRLRAVVARQVHPSEYRDDLNAVDERLDELEREVAVNTDRVRRKR